MIVSLSSRQSSIGYQMTNRTKPLIFEEKKAYMDHDQLFKALIHTFFEEFIEVFFSDVHKHIDFSLIKPMSEEVFTDLLDGESRTLELNKMDWRTFLKSRNPVAAALLSNGI